MNRSTTTVAGRIKIKIAFLGNQAVGKSSIIEKYIHDRFDETSNPTVGIDYLAKNIVYKSRSYRLQLWDTAGQERFRSLIPGYLKDAQCALIVFDVTNKVSLNSIDEWLKLFNDNKIMDGFSVLIGNKTDLDYRQISQEQIRTKAQSLSLPYFQISAKTGDNIDNLFSMIIDLCVDKELIPQNTNQLDKNESVMIKQVEKQEENDNDKNKVDQNQKVENVVLQNKKISKKNHDKNNCC